MHAFNIKYALLLVLIIMSHEMTYAQDQEDQNPINSTRLQQELNYLELLHSDNDENTAEVMTPAPQNETASTQINENQPVSDELSTSQSAIQKPAPDQIQEPAMLPEENKTIRKKRKSNWN